MKNIFNYLKRELPTELFFGEIQLSRPIKKKASIFKGNLVDVGCGSLKYRKYFLNVSKYLGIDKKFYGKNILGDAYFLPIKKNSIDNVACFQLLEHCAEPDNIIKEIRRILKPNGNLFISVPMTWGLHYEPFDYYRFTKYGISYLLIKNKFEIKETIQVGNVISVIGLRIIDTIYRSAPKFNNKKIKYPFLFLLRISLYPLNLFFYFLSEITPKSKDAHSWYIIATKGKIKEK